MLTTSCRGKGGCGSLVTEALLSASKSPEGTGRIEAPSTSHSSYRCECCLGFMIYRLGGGSHIASGCGNFKSSPYLLVSVGFDYYIIATLLQDIEPEIVV